MTSRVSAAIAIIAVIAVLAFYASTGTFYFTCTECERAPYATLAEGFLRGQLSMTTEPDPRLLSLYDPYNADLRNAVKAAYTWDASLFEGKYYLYFTPLPALLFYAPVKLLTGVYPSDAFVAFLFCVWALVMSVAFAMRALRREGRPLVLPLPLWIALIGLGNVLPYLLPDIRMYEVAILCGTAMSATWAYSLLRFMDGPSVRRGVWMGVWLALAIASRPNVGVLVVIAAIAVWRAGWRVALATFAPLVVTGLLLASYNYARFHDPFEFGVKYQLTYVPMRDYKVCSLCTPAEVARLVNGTIHYVFWPPAVGSEFPFVSLQLAKPDPALTFPSGPEPVGGIAALVPLVLLAWVFALMQPRRDDPATLVMSGACLVLLGLATCWWFTARYAIDFMMLMVAAAVVLVERGLQDRGALRAAAVALIAYSIVISLLLGFIGWSGAFQRKNPQLYETVRSALG